MIFSRQESKQRFGSFGLEVKELSETSAKVLEPCEVVYMRGNQESTADINKEKGSWNLANGLSFIQPASSNGWAIVICEQLMPDEKDIDGFVDTFKKIAGERRVRLGDHRGIISYRQEPVEALLERCINEFGNVGLVVCIIGNAQGKNVGTYAAIKRWSHTVSGIPTQCVQASKALKTGGRGFMSRDMQYHAGIMLKVNLKLGGINVRRLGPS